MYNYSSWKILKGIVAYTHLAKETEQGEEILPACQNTLYCIANLVGSQVSDRIEKAVSATKRKYEQLVSTFLV